MDVLMLSHTRAPNNSEGSPVEICIINKTHAKVLSLHPWALALIISAFIFHYHNDLNLHQILQLFDYFIEAISAPFHNASSPFLILHPLPKSLLYLHITLWSRKFMLHYDPESSDCDQWKLPIRNGNKSCQQQMSSQRLFFPIIQLTFLKLPSLQHLLTLSLKHLLSLLLASWLLCCPLSFRIFVSPLNPLTYLSMIGPSGGSDMPPKTENTNIIPFVTPLPCAPSWTWMYQFSKCIYVMKQVWKKKITA